MSLRVMVRHHRFFLFHDFLERGSSTPRRACSKKLTIEDVLMRCCWGKSILSLSGCLLLQRDRTTGIRLANDDEGRIDRRLPFDRSADEIPILLWQPGALHSL